MPKITNIQDITVRLMYRIDSDEATKEDKAINPFNFKDLQCEFLELASYLEENCSYSAGLYINGKRKNTETDLTTQNLIILDIDDGISIQTAAEHLQEYHCLFHTTRNHSEKKDKFRIILPIESEFGIDYSKEVFSKFMEAIGVMFDLTLDEGVFDKSRFYESVPFTTATYMYELYEEDAGHNLKVISIDDINSMVEVIERNIKRAKNRKIQRETLRPTKENKEDWNLDSVLLLPKYQQKLEDIKSGNFHKPGFAMGAYLKMFSGVTQAEIINHLIYLKDMYYTGDHQDAYDEAYWTRYLFGKGV